MSAIEDIASSRARLTIASLISSRPRALGELAAITGISVQGVLKHLTKLRTEGLAIREWNMPSGKYLRPRKLYHIENRKVADFSQRDLLVAALGEGAASVAAGEEGGGARDAATGGDTLYDELDRLAQDVIIQERRANELSRRMTRTIGDVLASESRMSALIDSMSYMTPDEKQVAYLIFGEDEPEAARRTLRDHYGCLDPDSAIREVTRKIRRSRRR